MQKIRTAEELRVKFDGDVPDVHIAESSEGVYDITFEGGDRQRIRIGIPYPDGEGTYHTFLSSLFELAQPQIGRSL